eukprot:5695423-Amphidinium_carterae.1
MHRRKERILALTDGQVAAQMHSASDDEGLAHAAMAHYASPLRTSLIVPGAFSIDCQRRDRIEFISCALAFL